MAVRNAAAPMTHRKVLVCSANNKNSFLWNKNDTNIPPLARAR